MSEGVCFFMTSIASTEDDSAVLLPVGWELVRMLQQWVEVMRDMKALVTEADIAVRAGNEERRQKAGEDLDAFVAGMNNDASVRLLEDVDLQELLSKTIAEEESRDKVDVELMVSLMLVQKQVDLSVAQIDRNLVAARAIDRMLQ